MTDLISPADAATMLTCTRRNIYKLIAQRRLRAVRPLGRWHIERTSVEAYASMPHPPGPKRGQPVQRKR